MQKAAVRMDDGLVMEVCLIVFTLRLVERLDANNAPNVFWSRQGEDEAGKEDGGAGPFKLTSLAKIKIRAAKLYKERDGEDHIQRREHHLLHHAFNLRSGLLPCLLHSTCHIAARGKGGGAAERGQEQERQRQNHDFIVFQNLNLLLF